MKTVKLITVHDINDIQRNLSYVVDYKVHPDYEGMSVRELKKIFNFDEGESVPDIGYIDVISSMDGLMRSDVESEIKSEEGTNDLIFQW